MKKKEATMTARMREAAFAVAVLALAGGAPGCHCGGGGGKTDGGNTLGVDSGNILGVDSGGGGATIPCTTTAGTVWQCGNGIDDDGDGQIDLADGNCVGPCDDDESSFATGIPGDNVDACMQDCFFDGNSGMGDDGCNWNLRCDPANPGGTACPYDPSFMNCPTTVTPTCLMNCAAVCTTGCDCFGCCDVVTADGSTVQIYLGSGPDCTYETPENCENCTQNEACLCPTPPPPTGGTDAGVPGADSGVPPPTCPCSNSQACATTTDCPMGYTCGACGECVASTCMATADCGTGFFCSLQIGSTNGCCVFIP
jgi:hypothetical protein